MHEYQLKKAVPFNHLSPIGTALPTLQEDEFASDSESAEASETPVVTTFNINAMKMNSERKDKDQKNKRNMSRFFRVNSTSHNLHELISTSSGYNLKGPTQLSVASPNLKGMSDNRVIREENQL